MRNRPPATAGHIGSSPVCGRLPFAVVLVLVLVPVVLDAVVPEVLVPATAPEDGVDVPEDEEPVEPEMDADVSVALGVFPLT
jgi:hypothetical protein